MQPTQNVSSTSRALRSNANSTDSICGVAIYGHGLFNATPASVHSVAAAKETFIDLVLSDLDSRIDGFNTVIPPFDCVFKLLDLRESELRDMSKTLARAYAISHSDLLAEMILFRTIMQAKVITFAYFMTIMVSLFYSDADA